MINSNIIYRNLTDHTQLIISKNRVEINKLFDSLDLPTELQPFTASSLGDFPYYWQSPLDLTFNQKTYRWICSSLKKDVTPIQLGTPFTNLYISALASISYSLSQADVKKLNQAAGNIKIQQTALLHSWRNNILGNNNSPTINQVIKAITQTWASPPTTLEALQQANNLIKKLNKTPANGKAVVVVLSAYLNALNSENSLINASSRNTGYLAQALVAVQSPNSKNGGLLTTSENFHPAYMVSPSVHEIVKSLNSTDKEKSFKLKMLLSFHDANKCTVSIGTEEPETLFAKEVMEIIVNTADNSYVNLIKENSAVESEVTISGVTMVYFSPTPYDMSSQKNWYWMTPIIEAIKNNDKDESSFTFTPNPGIDFSLGGPFSFLTGAAISKEISIKIKIQNQNLDHKKTVKQIKEAKSIKLNFLNRITNNLSTEPDSVLIDDINSSISLKFSNPKIEIANNMDSTAFVLGVQTQYPAAQH